VKNHLLAIVFFVQILLIGLGACNITPRFQGIWGKVFAIHHWLTGITNFSFYAPNVSEQIRDEVTIELENGEVISDRLETAYHSRESIIRIYDLINGFAFTMNKEELKRAYAASLAGEMFARYPRSRKITLKLFLYDVPSMAEAAKGASAVQTLLYEGKFARGEKVASQI